MAERPLPTISELAKGSYTDHVVDVLQTMPKRRFVKHAFATGLVTGGLSWELGAPVPLAAVIGLAAGAVDFMGVPLFVATIERTVERVKAVGHSIAEVAANIADRRVPEITDEMQLLYGDTDIHHRIAIERYYPGGRYLLMIKEKFAPGNDAAREEREKLWECRDRFWGLMQEAQATTDDNTFAIHDLGKIRNFLIQTMHDVIVEKNPDELEFFEGNSDSSILSHLRATESSIKSVTTALSHSKDGEKFLTTRNRGLLEFVASIHDLFNGLSRREGQVMLDHQFILEDFIKTFFHEGQIININDDDTPLTKRDIGFMLAVSRHENIFEEKKWDKLVTDMSEDNKRQINHALLGIFLADVLGDGLSFNEDTKTLEINSRELKKRLKRLMRRHMSHTDQRGIPLTNKDGEEIDGKIFRPEWILSVKTIVNAFRTLAKFKVTIGDKDGYATPFDQLVYAAIDATDDAIKDRVVDKDGKDVKYTAEQIGRISNVRSKLQFFLMEFQ